MRKAIFGFLLLLCSVLAFGQEPQWTVIKHVTLMQQNQPTSGFLLTPTEPGIYRLTLYFSGGDRKGSGGFEEMVNGTDVTGRPLSQWTTYGLDCSELYWQPIPPVTISLLPNAPLTYQVYSNSSSPSCTYTLAITVEQLMQ